ncbi:MAG: glycosyltransferase family 2 protein [Endomicrobia bacterium]|nr:glycosyltransferase family 2 protein [Endomicrobiia bacterium]MCL2506451.1 glycosyltransferase family 2 protein [Endomicrobiia bacterium]
MNFSVIIPVYNIEKYIKRTIDSVLNQTVPNFEIIIVNDGSSDGTLSVVESIKDERIKIINQKNLGVTKARNTGIKNAKYDYIACLDHDDEYLPDFLETISDMIENFPQAGLYATAYRVLKKDKSFIPKYTSLPKFPWTGIVPSYFKTALGYHPLLPSSTVVKREVYDSVGMFSETIQKGEDIELWARAAAKYKIAFTSKVCAIWHRDGAPTLSNKQVEVIDYEFINTLEKINSSGICFDNDKKYLKEFINKKYLDIAETYLKNGDFENTNNILKKVKTKKFFFKKLKMQFKSALLKSKLSM